jgi:chaperonin GroEL
MAKILKFDTEAREKLLKGINLLTDAVAATLGPKGQNVAIDKKWGAPNVVHDGVTVAKEIELEDPFENMGAQLLKEADSKTNDVAGDGTTTATVLAQAIVSEGLKNIQAGANSMVLRKGIEKAVEALVAQLRTMSKKITNFEETTQVATISAQNKVIGKTISEALNKVGKDGRITHAEAELSYCHDRGGACGHHRRRHRLLPLLWYPGKSPAGAATGNTRAGRGGWQTHGSSDGRTTGDSNRCRS